MTRKSPGTYVLVLGLVVLVGGAVLLALPGPGLLVFAAGTVITAVGVVALLVERSQAKVAATVGPDRAVPPAR